MFIVKKNITKIQYNTIQIQRLTHGSDFFTLFVQFFEIIMEKTIQ